MALRRAGGLTVVAVLLALAALLARSELPAQAQPPATATPACASTLPARLILRERGRVRLSDPSPLNVRSEPGTSSDRIGEIAAGGLFYVLSGPRCTALYSWYRVEFSAGGQTARGWIAEGSVSEGYFTEPYPPGR